MNEYTQKLKAILTAKNIADVTFVLSVFAYVCGHVLLFLLDKQIGFLTVLIVILYTGLAVVVLSVISLIARSLFLYKNPTARTRVQKVLLAITAVPLWNLLLKSLATVL